MAEPMIKLGVTVPGNRPVELPLSILERHCWIQALSGAGKSLLASSLLVQLLSLASSACVVVADFGGDLYVFNRLSAACQLSSPQRVLRFLSTAADDDWHSFEPLQSVVPLTRAGIPRAASYCVSSMSLDHAEGFGKAYYSKQNYAVFLRGFGEFVDEGVLYPTFSELCERIRGQAQRTRLSDIAEAHLSAEQLLGYPMLADDPAPNRRIDVARALEDAEVLYGFFPVLHEPPVRSLGAMLVWSLVFEAMRRTYAGLPPRRIYLVIDEFAAVSSAKAFADLLTLARKYGISLILISQSSSQLSSRDRELFPVIADNTAVKIWMTPTSPDDIEFLQSLSPDVLKEVGKSTSASNFTPSASVQKRWEPELSKNDSLATAFTGQEFFLIYNDWKGHHPPIRCRFIPEVTREEHARLSNTPLPKRPQPQPRSSGGNAAPNKAQAGPATVPSPGAQRRRAALAALLQKLKDREDWEGGA
jgi:DNA helicase HerA-like ATPase